MSLKPNPLRPPRLIRVKSFGRPAETGSMARKSKKPLKTVGEEEEEKTNPVNLTRVDGEDWDAPLSKPPAFETRKEGDPGVSYEGVSLEVIDLMFPSDSE